MKILIDAQLPPALKVLFGETGHEAHHVVEVGLRDAADSVVWDYALREGAVVFTKDEDFAARRLVAPRGPTIVWLRVGNCSRAALMRWLKPLVPSIIALTESGERVIEVR